MAYPRPSLATIIQRVIGDISSRTEGSAFVKSAPERVLAFVLGGVAHGLHGHVEQAALQLLPTTCDLAGLRQWGDICNPKVTLTPATVSTGPATFTGANGSLFAAGNLVQTVDGLVFEVTSGGTVAGGTVTVAVTAELAGAAGNIEPGAKLSLVSPVAGINTDGLVADPGLLGAADEEETEEFRERVLAALRVPPAGGGPGDYVAWAREVAGVTRAWEFGNRMGYGTVSLGFVMEGRSNVIPAAPDVAAVQAYIDALRPLDMRAFYCIAPVGLAVDMTIAIRPNTSPVRDAVNAALYALFRSDDNVFEEPLDLSKVTEAISTAAGEDAHSITSIGSLVPGPWQMLTLGTVTFTTLA